MINEIDLLTLNEVKNILKYKQIDSVKKWLSDNDVRIHHFGNKRNMVFKIDFDSILMIEKGKELRNLYPTNWKEILEFYINDNRLLKIVLFKLTSDTEYLKPTTIVKPINNNESSQITGSAAAAIAINNMFILNYYI